MLPFYLLLALIGASRCYQNSVYYPSWGIHARNYHHQDLPVDKTSHVLYAFMDVHSSGEVYSKDTFSDLEKPLRHRFMDGGWGKRDGCVKQLFLLKKHNRGLETLLSIGGWTHSANFTTAASTEVSRMAFARTSVTLMKNWGFDGIDVDWEYPVNAEEAANFVLLLKAVRHELDGYEELDAAPQVLVHGDLSGNNVIVDNHSNAIRGIIDLGWVELVPLQFAASYPRFLTHEPDRGVGFKGAKLSDERMRRDREFFLQCIRNRAQKDSGNSMLQHYYEVLARDDEITRYWWIAAASRIDIHHAMIKCNWSPEV